MFVGKGRSGRRRYKAKVARPWTISAYFQEFSTEEGERPSRTYWARYTLLLAVLFISIGGCLNSESLGQRACSLLSSILLSSAEQ